MLLPIVLDVVVPVGVDGDPSRSGSYEAEKDDGDEQNLESHFLYWIGEGFGKYGRFRSKGMIGREILDMWTIYTEDGRL
jgi:hypothetical protein